MDTGRTVIETTIRDRAVKLTVARLGRTKQNNCIQAAGGNSAILPAVEQWTFMAAVEAVDVEGEPKAYKMLKHPLFGTLAPDKLYDDVSRECLREVLAWANPEAFGDGDDTAKN